MIKSDGACRINGVELGEFQVAFFAPSGLGMTTPALAAKYALVNVEAGQRMGAGNRNVWSAETMSKLSELVASMEKDICTDVFGEATTSSVVEDEDYHSDGVPGL